MKGYVVRFKINNAAEETDEVIVVMAVSEEQATKLAREEAYKDMDRANEDIVASSIKVTEVPITGCGAIYSSLSH